MYVQVNLKIVLPRAKIKYIQICRPTFTFALYLGTHSI